MPLCCKTRYRLAETKKLQYRLFSNPFSHIDDYRPATRITCTVADQWEDIPGGPQTQGWGSWAITELREPRGPLGTPQGPGRRQGKWRHHKVFTMSPARKTQQHSFCHIRLWGCSLSLSPYTFYSVVMFIYLTYIKGGHGVIWCNVILGFNV